MPPRANFMHRRSQRRPILAVSLTAAGLGATVGPSASADITFADALAIAQDAVPDGVIKEIEDERYATEITFEVELIRDDGRQIADVEIDIVSGEINTIDHINQSADERSRWQEILGLIGSAQLDFNDAIADARDEYPEASITLVQLDVEFGVLQYDVTMEDYLGAFQIEIDAETGAMGNNLPRGKRYAQIETLSNAANPRTTLLSIEYTNVGGDDAFETLAAKRRGKKETTTILDEQTGDVLSRTTRTTPRRWRDTYRQMMVLSRDATIDFGRAVQVSLNAVGNGRPARTELDVRNDTLYYLTTVDVGLQTSRVWVEAVTGDVWRVR